MTVIPLGANAARTSLTADLCEGLKLLSSYSPRNRPRPHRAHQDTQPRPSKNKQLTIRKVGRFWAMSKRPNSASRVGGRQALHGAHLSYRRKLVTARIGKAAYRGCLRPPLLHWRSGMPCPTITCSNW